MAGHAASRTPKTSSSKSSIPRRTSAKLRNHGLARVIVHSIHNRIAEFHRCTQPVALAHPFERRLPRFFVGDGRGYPPVPPDVTRATHVREHQRDLALLGRHLHHQFALAFIVTMRHHREQLVVAHLEDRNPHGESSYVDGNDSASA